MIKVFNAFGKPIVVNPIHVVGVKSAPNGTGILVLSTGAESKTGIPSGMLADIFRYGDDWKAEPREVRASASRNVRDWPQSPSLWKQTKLALPLEPEEFIPEGNRVPIPGLAIVGDLLVEINSIEWAFDIVTLGGSVIEIVTL